jgi:hypothetical protein
MIGFLILAALLTAAPFVIWGVLSVAGNVTNEICTGFDVVLAGGESSLPITIPCPDVSESARTMNEAMKGINDLTGSINEELQSALSLRLTFLDLYTSV